MSSELCGEVGDGVNQAADLISAIASISVLELYTADDFEGSRGPMNEVARRPSVPNPASARRGRCSMASMLRDFEKGRRKPTIDELEAIRRALEAKGVILVEGSVDGPGVRLRKADGVIRATWNPPPAWPRK